RDGADLRQPAGTVGIARTNSPIPPSGAAVSSVSTDGGAVGVAATGQEPNGLWLGVGLAAFLDAAPDAILAVDSVGTIRAVNNQAALLFGYAADSLIGRRV